MFSFKVQTRYLLRDRDILLFGVILIKKVFLLKKEKKSFGKTPESYGLPRSTSFICLRQSACIFNVNN